MVDSSISPYMSREGKVVNNIREMVRLNFKVDRYEISKKHISIVLTMTYFKIRVNFVNFEALSENDKSNKFLVLPSLTIHAFPESLDEEFY